MKELIYWRTFNFIKKIKLKFIVSYIFYLILLIGIIYGIKSSKEFFVENDRFPYMRFLKDNNVANIFKENIYWFIVTMFPIIILGSSSYENLIDAPYHILIRIKSKSYFWFTESIILSVFSVAYYTLLIITSLVFTLILDINMILDIGNIIWIINIILSLSIGMFVIILFQLILDLLIYPMVGTCTAIILVVLNMYIPSIYIPGSTIDINIFDTFGGEYSLAYGQIFNILIAIIIVLVGNMFYKKTDTINRFGKDG